MCVICQTISVGAAALTGILPVAAPEPEALQPIPAGVSSNAAQASLLGGKACKKLGQTRKTSAGSFRCTAVGKRKTWRLVRAASAKSSTTTTTIRQPSAGDICSGIGDRSTVVNGYLECRKVSGGVLQWMALSNSPSAPAQAS